MSRFSNAFSTTLTDLGWTQTHLAELSGIPRPQINRYARGVSSVEQTSLARILEVIPSPHKHLVLKAYLEDVIPEEFSHLIRFDSGDFKREPGGRLPPGMDTELRKAVLDLAALGVKHTEIRDLLIGLLKALDAGR